VLTSFDRDELPAVDAAVAEAAEKVLTLLRLATTVFKKKHDGDEHEQRSRIVPL